MARLNLPANSSTHCPLAMLWLQCCDTVLASLHELVALCATLRCPLYCRGQNLRASCAHSLLGHYRDGLGHTHCFQPTRVDVDHHWSKCGINCISWPSLPFPFGTARGVRRYDPLPRRPNSPIRRPVIVYNQKGTIGHILPVLAIKGPARSG